MTAASPPFRPMLRLVYPPGYPVDTSSSGDEREMHAPDPVSIEAPPRPAQVKAATNAITRENRDASTISASDAREILTMRVAELLQGGRAAILTPDRRTRAIRIARMLGVRDFDAHLVIAVVQDRARRGEIRVGAQEPDGRRASIAPERRVRTRPFHDRGAIVALQLASAVLLAAAMLLGVMNWLG